MSSAASIETWRTAARAFEAPHGRISYWTEGDGPAVVLLHGFPTSSWDWRRLWAPLARRRRVIALDFLGFGLSTKPRRGRRIADQADAVERLCAHLDVTAADMIAHDYGGFVAQELLARQGEGRIAMRLESVTLLSIGPGAEPPRAAERRLANALGGALGLFASRNGFARAFASQLAPAFRPSAAEIDETWTLIRENHGHTLGRRLLRAAAAERKQQRVRWTGAIAARTAPERLIFGAPTPASGAATARAIRRRMPHADIVLMDGVGRWPHLEAPDAVLEAVESFHASVHVRALAAYRPSRVGRANAQRAREPSILA